MLLTTIGDDAVKVFEAFTYDEGESAERFDVVVRKFREYCTPVRNIVYERFLFWQHAQTPGKSIDQYVTRQRHLAKCCNFMEEDNMIRDHIVFTCLDARLKDSYTRLPFGIASAPEVFQKRANEIFGDIPDVFVIFDDLLIAAASDGEHEQTLRKVFLFERAREKCVSFNRNKIQLRVRQCKYIGHLLTSEGICPDPDKVKAISDMGPTGGC